MQKNYENIKFQLVKLKNEGKILDFNLKNDRIVMENLDGTWEFISDNNDFCEHCGEKADYMVVLNRFTQTYTCKNCLLYSLKHYNENSFKECQSELNEPK